MNARQTAYAVLSSWEEKGSYANITLDHALQKQALSPADRALASALVYGVIERRITLDYIISALSSRKPEDIDPDARCALRMGLYQLIFMDRVPPHAAVGETVALCRRRSAGFVNALLRAYTRLTAPIPMPSTKSDPAYALSVRYSVCIALAERLLDVLGTERAEAFLASTLQATPTTLRVNTQKTDREELLSHLSHATPTVYSPVGIRTTGSVRELYGFDEGFFFVQDEASQICVSALDARAGMTVVDVCSCPGSKSFGAAIDMNNKGTLYAFDLHGNKLSLVQSGAERLGLSILRTAVRDGRSPDPSLFGLADRVICDVPCSGFGVLAKKPELRYKDPKESTALPAIQRAILEQSASYLKKDGMLVYSTCTILPEENELVVKDFLACHKDFSLLSFAVGDLRCPEGMITLMPDRHGTDGFFIARLQKNT